MKKGMKRIICLLMAMVLILGLAACSSGQGGGAGGNNADDIPTVRWIAADPGHPGRNEVEEEIKRYVKEKINVNLVITWVDAATNDVLSTLVTAGEWDVANIDGNMFNSNVARNAFLALDDYIDEYLPTAKELLPEEAFKAFQRNGKTYGVSSYKDLAEVWGILYNVDLFEEFGIELPEGYTTERDLVPLYYEVSEAYNEANPNNTNAVIKPSTWLNSWFQFDSLCGSWGNTLACTNIPGTDGFGTTDTYTVFSPYFTDEYREYVRTVWQMVQDDLIPRAAGDGEMRWGEGEGFCQISCGWIEIDPNQFGNWNVGWYPSDVAVSSTSTLQNNVNVLSANCTDPEAALKFLEMTYSDEYLCTTLKFGIEGKDWADENNDGVVELLERNADAGNRFWYDWYGARNSNVLGGKIAQGSSPEFPEKLEALNASGVASLHAGFSMDVSSVSNEIAACNNVLAQYTGMLTYPNFDDPDKFVDDFCQALRDNGIDKIVAEAQRQLDEWHAAN